MAKCSRTRGKMQSGFADVMGFTAHTKTCIPSAHERSPIGIESFTPSILPILKDEKKKTI